MSSKGAADVPVSNGCVSGRRLWSERCSILMAAGRHTVELKVASRKACYLAAPTTRTGAGGSIARHIHHARRSLRRGGLFGSVRRVNTARVMSPAGPVLMRCHEPLGARSGRLTRSAPRSDPAATSSEPSALGGVGHQVQLCAPRYLTLRCC